MKACISQFARLHYLALTALVAILTSCGDKDNEQADPSPPKDVRIVMTGVDAGSASTIDGVVILKTDSPSSITKDPITYEIAQFNEVFQNFNGFSKGEFIDIEMAFQEIKSPRRITGNTSITTEVYVDGVSVKRMVLNSATTTYNSKGEISIKDRFTL